ncbi:OmpA family protein [uncultured Formosa sp.]|uniref:OmpA family protein n=1 Tax=uncultured Formosa sp. TaxID=255435 RepID=UPI00260AF598|nr:OmpA family protein [uncultured Formosa sp.]
MKIYAILLLSLMSLMSVQAQEQPSNRKKANEYFDSYQYGKAILLYQKLTDVEKPKLIDMERLAYCYSQVNDYELSSNWYARIVDYPKSNPENLLLYATTLKQTARYAEAKKVLEKYIQTEGSNQDVAIQMAGCDAAIKWMANPLDYKIKNEKEVNTPLSEFAAYPLNNEVYYTGEEPKSGKLEHLSWTGASFLKIFKADVDSTSLELSNTRFENVVFNKGNHKFHVGPVASNKSGNVFYVTRTYSGKDGQKTKKGKVKYKTNKLELYIYTKENEGWVARPFAYNNVKKYSIGHATLSTDEQILYYVSDMEGSIGGSDIWYSEKQADGSWGEPINAGKTINGYKNEMFPSIAPDGTLYFSSNSLVGLGGLDIFKAKGSKDRWSNPENLKYPVNSGGDDFAYVINKEKEKKLSGFFSSNRSGGIGKDDIYSFKYEEPKLVIVLQGITYEGETTDKELSDVKVSLFSKDRELIAQKSSGYEGDFIFELTPGTEFKLLSQKQEFYSDSLTISTKNNIKNDTIKVALHLKPLLEVGKKFVIEGIFYDFDKYNIRTDAQIVLNELIRIMRDNPTLKIELSSHTDSRGDDDYNIKLSQNRAQSAVDYLVSRGIARDRMIAKGYGETRLVNKCKNGVPCSKELHQENRRTEIEVLSY